MWLSLSFAVYAVSKVDPPTGGISPLAWVIISALVLVCATVVPALWHRGNKERDKAESIRERMYEDLKECNKKRADSEEEILGLMKLLSLMMEQAKSKGGKKG
jgi:hypothetical protein